MPATGHRSCAALLGAVACAAAVASAPGRGASDAGTVPRRLTLRASAQVECTCVTLADVVAERLPPPWAQLPLAFAPAPGATLQLSAALVRRKLAMDAPAAPPAISGAASCQVQRVGSAAWGDATAVQAAMLRVLAQAPLPPRAMAQRFVLRTAPVTNLVGDLDVQLAGPPPEVGTATARFRLRDPRGIEGAAQVVITRALQLRAWVAARELSAGTTLTAQDVRPDSVWVDTTRGLDDLLRKEDSPTGYRTTRVVAAGAPLARSDLRRAPVVRQGDRVAWIVRRGDLLVTVRATARSEGGVGDQVWIESPFDRSLRRLRVLDAGLVGDAPPPERQPSLLAGLAEAAAPTAAPIQEELP